MPVRHPFHVVMLMASASCCVAISIAEETAPLTVEYRVESEVHSGLGKEPVSRSLTLFRDRLAWDFPAIAASDDEEKVAETGEFALHDPARGRAVLVSPGRNVKVTVERITLDRLSASLAAWARTAEDDVVRWAGGPDFTDGLDERKGAIELHGPLVRYAVAFDRAPSSREAAAYREFADTAILLKALVHPGGIPPFPRMAINDRVAAAGGIPREVELEIDATRLGSKLAASGISSAGKRFRSIHRFHPRLIESDHRRIEAAMARMAVAREVPLAEYAENFR